MARKISARRFSFYRADEGASLVEFALLAPLLVLLLIGLVEVGRYTAFAIQVGNAARAGAAYGARVGYSNDLSGMDNAATNDGQLSQITPTATNSCTCADGTADAGCTPTNCSASHRIVYVHVTTTGTFKSLFGYPGIPASIPISATTTLQVPE